MAWFLMSVPLSELNTNSKELTFFQGGIASNRRSESNDSRRTTINLGVNLTS
jgi:hypothetical protein